MNNIGFLQLPLNMDWKAIEPMMWDRQTLAILSHTSILEMVKADIRSKHKPTSHSEGNGYEIDVYTNLNYNVWETDPAMRNIKVVYCDIGIMDMESVNKRFPNAYIVKVGIKKGDVKFEPQRIGREIPQISCN